MHYTLHNKHCLVDFNHEIQNRRLTINVRSLKNALEITNGVVSYLNQNITVIFKFSF